MVVNKFLTRLQRQQSEVKEPEIVNNDKSLFICKPGTIKTTMNHVGGYKEAKVELLEIVNFFRDLKKYEKLGAQMPKGALFYGGHGNGKSLIIKAAAGEADVPFLSYSCAGFLVGDNGAERLSKVFELARHMSPSILFLDELQSIGKDRNNKCSKNSVQMRSVLDELLTQLDGFEQHKDKFVIVLAATGNICVIDPALTRPGRFDRLIELPNPDSKDREEIFDIHLRPIKTSLDKKLISEKYSALTNGMSAADIALVCNESAMAAGRHLADEVDMHHFDKALERVKYGVKKRKPFDNEAKRIVAYHNAGHALIDNLLESKLLANVHIYPDTDGNFSCCTNSMKLCGNASIEIVAVLMAGMAAEELIFGHYTACNENDLMQATVALTDLTTAYGLSDFGKIHTKNWYGRNFSHLKSQSTCGDGNYIKIFQEMENQIEAAFDKAKTLVTENADTLKKLAETLMEKNSLTMEEMTKIMQK